MTISHSREREENVENWEGKWTLQAIKIKFYLTIFLKHFLKNFREMKNLWKVNEKWCEKKRRRRKMRENVDGTHTHTHPQVVSSIAMLCLIVIVVVIGLLLFAVHFTTNFSIQKLFRDRLCVCVCVKSEINRKLLAWIYWVRVEGNEKNVKNCEKCACKVISFSTIW